MLMYASLEKFRQLTPFTKGDVSDETITSLIPVADKAVMRIATIEVYDEELSGNVDGSNTIFTVKNKPIADRDLDRQISTGDVTVLLATKDAENNRVSTETTVSSVSSRDGRIILTTAPTTTTAELGVFCDYRYYSKAKMDFDVLAEAANYYLAFLASAQISQKSAINISSQFLTKIIASEKLRPGELDAQARSWLNLCLKTLGVMAGRSAGKVSNKKVSMKIGFSSD